MTKGTSKTEKKMREKEKDKKTEQNIQEPKNCGATTESVTYL